MAELPTVLDPTLQAVDAALEASGNAEPHRPYLGMSEIGRPCQRALWYGFRWCSVKSFDATTLKRFADGHHGEDVQADRLRLVDGIELITEDPRTGYQFGFADHGGHFRGHMDGRIKGILQAPATLHVWEHKQTDEKKLKALEKAKQEHGEKAALAQWDEVYSAQAVLYMHYSGMKRHYLTCASSGGRKTVSVRSNAAPDKAKALKAKALRIIQSDVPLTRISEKPDWYQCKWCDHQAICHEGELPEINCRTCVHATPELDGNGRWSCAHFGCDLSTKHQRQGGECPEHRYIPALIHFAEAVDADQAGNWIEYRAGETTFRNGGNYYTSAEIKALGRAGLVPEVLDIKKPSAAPGANQNQSQPPSTSAPWLPAESAATTEETKTAALASVPAPWAVKG